VRWNTITVGSDVEHAVTREESRERGTYARLINLLDGHLWANKCYCKEKSVG